MIIGLSLQEVIKLTLQGEQAIKNKIADLHVEISNLDTSTFEGATTAASQLKRSLDTTTHLLNYYKQYHTTTIGDRSFERVDTRERT